LAIPPRAFRLKLQGRLLLLCLGAALPITTLFALSLFDQFYFARTQVQNVNKTKLFALAKSFEVWGQQQFTDMNAKPLKHRPQWKELYRVLPDGRATVYYPDRDKTVKLPYGVNEIFSQSHKGANIALYGQSPLSGERLLLLISGHDKDIDEKASKTSNAILKEVKVQTKHSARTHRHKSRGRHRVSKAQKNISVKEPKSDLSESILVVAVEPKELSELLAKKAEELDASLNVPPQFSIVAIADPKREIFATTDQHMSLAKSEKDRARLIQSDNQLLLLPLNLYLSAIPNKSLDQSIGSKFIQTILLALAVLLSSSYLVFLASKHFSKQIRLLVKEVLALGHGDFSKRLEIKSNDEIGRLAKAFNQIASNMQIEHDHRLLEEKISLAIRQSLD
jgi:HAMP domain-containing protein